MIIYFCQKCELDSGCTEQDQPVCYCCDSPDHLVELSRSPLTPKILADRMKLCADRMMDNLHAAYESKDESLDPKEEELLLNTLVQAKSTQKGVHRVTKKMVKQAKKI